MLASLHRVLAPFFTFVQRLLFVEVQQLSGALISGSTALSFFNEETYPDSDLDVFVDFEWHIPVFEFLEDAGYQYLPRDGQPDTLQDIIDERIPPCNHAPGISFNAPGDYQGHTVVKVLNFTRTESSRRVQVILTRGCPLLSIFQFHSSESTFLCVYM